MPPPVLAEPVGELLNDARLQHVGDGQDLGEDLVERLDVVFPPSLQAGLP